MAVSSLAGRYRVIGRLGAGGMAVVMLAEDERLGRKVAVKRLRADGSGDAAKRFEREAKLGASLNHPNIVAVYDIVSDEDDVLIVMEYVDGHTLRLEMDSGPMSPARVIEVLSGVAAGLDHAHEHGVVHRDVKPANVLIAKRDGAVKLADLGIATAAERTHITQSGVVLGTASYMAPERLDGNAGGPGVDVYATAAVAFEMLSGRKAVTGKSAVEIARRVMEAPPPDLAEVLPGAPARAAAVLRRGLAKDPQDRQESVGQLVRELSAAYAEAAAPAPAPPSARAPAPAPAPAPAAPVAVPRRRRWIGAAVVGALVGVALAAALLAGGSGDKAGEVDSPATPAKKKETPKPAQSQKAPPQTSAAPTPEPDPEPQPQPEPTPATPAEDPGATLTSFYTRAANDDFEGAWAMGTDNLHAQFGSLETFRSTLSTLESIEFPALRVTSKGARDATVAFSSVAQHTDRTDTCSGQATLVAQGSSWRIDNIDVSCRQAKNTKKTKKPKR
jgi:eukaryotic-like serine/threonine-protein kinase